MTSNYIIIVLTTLFINGGICAGQSPKQLYFHHLNIEQKLSQTTNGFIFKDSRGFVWISSNDGLNRYDGKKIKVYQPIPGDTTSIFGNNIQSYFYEDSTGNIWFSTFEAINCYVRESGTFKHYRLRYPDSTFAYGYYVCGIDSADKLWIIIENEKLYQFDKYKRFVPFDTLFPGAQRGNFKYDHTGRVSQFIAYAYDPLKPGIQITKYNALSQKQKEFYFSSSGNFDLPPRRVWQFYAENDTLIWLATREGLIAFNPANKQWKNYNNFGGQILEGFTCVRDYGKPYLILSSSKDGLLFFDKKKRVFSSQILRNGNGIYELSSNTIANIIVDQDTGLWLTINRVGVDFASPRKIKFQRHLVQQEATGIKTPISVNTLTTDKNGKYYGGTHNNGVYIFDENKKVIGQIIKDVYPVLPSNKILQIFSDNKNRIWILTWEGLAIYYPEKKRLEKLSDLDLVFLNGRMLQNGQILLCALTGGLYEAKENKMNIRFEKIKGIDSEKIYISIFESPKQSIYLCDILSIYKFNITREIIWEENIPVEGNIKCIYEPENDTILWIASESGLVQWNKNRKSIKKITIADGLPNATIHAIVPDMNGNLWLSTNRGIACWKSDSTCLSYGLADGLSSFEFNSGSFLSTYNQNIQEIWFGSTNGITTFFPTQIKSRLPFAKIQIIAIKINDEEMPGLKCSSTGATNAGEIKNLLLDYSKNTISFEFSAMEYSEPKSNRLFYRMLGSEKNWLEAGTDGIARYANLWPGTYRFQIRAYNSDGILNPEYNEVTIIIKKPYYQESWFIVLIALILLLMGFLIYRYRVIQIKRRLYLIQQTLDSEMKALRAQMSPHFIFNSINSINTYILKNKTKKASKYLNNFADLIRRILIISSKETINLEKEIEFLESYLSMESIRLKDKLTWRIVVAENVDDFDTEIPSMIFQPFVENAIWHGISHKIEGGLILIKILKEGNYIIFSIEDNGIGREEAERIRKEKSIQKASQGVSITMERLAIYDKKHGTTSGVEIMDLKDDSDKSLGTKVIVKISTVRLKTSGIQAVMK